MDSKPTELKDSGTSNTILPDGTIQGLDLDGGERLVVRDNAIPIRVEKQFEMTDGGVLELVIADPQWQSTVSLLPDVTPRLGGTLKISLAADADPLDLIGQTFDLFEWGKILDDDSRFTAIELPLGTRWDLGNLYRTGQATFLAVPEPNAIRSLITVGLMAFVRVRTARLAFCRNRVHA